MKVTLIILGLTFQLSFAKPFKGLEFLGQNPESLDLLKKNSFAPSLKIVQKRVLSKKFLSELSFGVSPVISGINYLYSSSFDIGYHFYFNEYINVNVNYSYFLHALNDEGKKVIFLEKKNPVELEFAQKQAALLGVDWMPFYGKIMAFNHVTHFDLYFSFSAGFIELLRLEQKFFPTASLGGGFVFWWNQWLNSRIEFASSYYRYEFSQKPPEVVEEYLSKIHISIGVLF